MDVQAVATLLTPSSDPQTEAVWDSILEITGSANLQLDGALHFSWHVAENYDLPAMMTLLSDLAHTISIFEIQTTGFGVFTALHPVLYLPIVKTERLSEFHKAIWNRIYSVSERTIPYYAPENWMPHITLANEESDFEGICKVGNLLMRKPLFMNFKVDNLAILFRSGSESGIIQRFSVGGQP